MMRAALAVALAAALGLACVVDDVTVAETTQPMSVCADGPTTYGIDVSRFQGDIDWQLVANSGVKFAFIQISRSLTDLDAKFAYNWKRAKEVGILRGAYQRFRPGMDVMGQAKLFVDTLGPFQKGDLPPMLDVEDADGLSAAQIAARVQQWLDYVEPRVGVRPIIYTGYYFWRDSVGGADFAKYPLWIANYSATCPLVPPTWTRWAFHQYSSTATIPGITANTVDVNKFNGTIEQLKALAEPPAPEPPSPVCDDEIAEGGGVLDDRTCFHVGADPTAMRTANAGYGSYLHWTYATDAATPSSYGQWHLQLARAGRYRVEAFTPAPYNGSQHAVYVIRHADTESRVAVDQRAVDGWNLIGELDFAAGGNGQYIRLDNNTGEPSADETKLVFDALRFTPVGKPDGFEEPAGEVGGGCSTRRPSTPWLLFAVILLRRRRARNPGTDR